VQEMRENPLSSTKTTTALRRRASFCNVAGSVAASSSLARSSSRELAVGGVATRARGA
jgi:hypothetical protein